MVLRANGDVGLFNPSVVNGKLELLRVIDYDANTNTLHGSLDGFVLDILGATVGGIRFTCDDAGNFLFDFQSKLNLSDMFPRVSLKISNPMSPSIVNEKPLIPKALIELLVNNIPTPVGATDMARAVAIKVGPHDMGAGLNGVSVNVDNLAEMRLGADLRNPKVLASVSAGTSPATKGEITINVDGSLTFKGANPVQTLQSLVLGDNLMKYLDKIVAFCDTHTHIDPVSGATGITTVPILPKVKVLTANPATHPLSKVNKSN